jgi:phosphoribosylformylglycinamidine cyclo-ligase
MQGSAYKEAGVDYDPVDEVKRLGQRYGAETIHNLPPGWKAIEESRGESAYVIDTGPFYLAFVPEGLGTKNLVVDSQTLLTKKTYYDSLAQDTIAMIVNDLITVGARPFIINAYWGIGNAKFFGDNPQKGKDLARGWTNACNESLAVYGPGELPILPGVIYPDTIDLGGSGAGVILERERLTLGDKLRAGDAMMLIGSSGGHANGYSLIRKIADTLPQKYDTPMPSEKTFGEAVLTPTYIYVKLQQALFEAGVDIHYMVNMTGHGWRKLMRARKEFTYRMHFVPDPQEEFTFLQKAGGLSDEEMYKTFNMGAGFAFMIHPRDILAVTTIAKSLGFRAWHAGMVEEGPKQVIIEPKNITYSADTLNIR